MWANLFTSVSSRNRTEEREEDFTVLNYKYPHLFRTHAYPESPAQLPASWSKCPVGITAQSTDASVHPRTLAAGGWDGGLRPPRGGADRAGPPPPNTCPAGHNPGPTHGGSTVTITSF